VLANPRVPLSQDTEIIANSGHEARIHLYAHHVTGRVQSHGPNLRPNRPRRNFSKPGRTKIGAPIIASMTKGTILTAYPAGKQVSINGPRLLRDQIKSGVRTPTSFLVLLAAFGLVFIIACSNLLI